MDESPPREIEAKYNITSPENARRLLSGPEAISGFAADEPETETCMDVYYDTASYDLVRRGLGLRVRRTGQAATVTAKGRSLRQETAVHDRVELQSKVDTGKDKAPFLNQTPPALQQAVRECNPDDKRLRPVLGLVQNRTTRKVYARQTRQPRGEPAALAELSLDDVYILREPPSMHLGAGFPVMAGDGGDGAPA